MTGSLTPDILEGRLVRLPAEASTALAARAALRALPALEHLTSPGQVLTPALNRAVLEIFRCTSTALSAAFWSKNHTIREHCDKISKTTNEYGLEANDQARDSARAARISIDVASSPNIKLAASHARLAVDLAVRAVARDHSHAGSLSENSVEHDLELLETHSSLLDAPLWPVGSPGWADNGWSRLSRNLLFTDSGWNVWTEWYTDRLKGIPPIEALETLRIGVDDLIWRDLPSKANAQIRRIVDAYVSETQSSAEVASFRQWLSHQPHSSQAILATRAAMRSVPALAELTLEDKDPFSATACATILSIFRGLAAGYAWPSDRAEHLASSDLSEVAQSIALGARQMSQKGFRHAGAAASAASRSTRAMLHDPSFSVLAAVANAARAFDELPILEPEMAQNAVDDPKYALKVDSNWMGMRGALSSDILSLASGTFDDQAPLWTAPAPSSADHDWGQLKRRLLSLNQGWDIWTDWYHARIHGLPSSAPLEQASLALSNKVWERRPAEINAELRRLIEELRQPQLPDLPDVVPGPGPYSITLRDGHFEAEPTAAHPNDVSIAQDLIDELSRVGQEVLLQLHDNAADPPLAAAVQTLLDHLCVPAASIRIGRLQIDLRVLQGFSAALATSGRRTDSTIRGLVSGLSDGLLDLTTQYRAILEMESGRAALHVVAHQDINELRRNMSDVVEVARASPTVGDSVAEALVEGDPQIAALTAKIEDPRTSHADRAGAVEGRSAIVGQQLLTHWNFTAQVLRVSKSTVGMAGSAAGEGIKDGIRKGFEQVTSATIKSAAVWLAVQLHQPMLAISLLVESFSPLAKRTKYAGEASSASDDQD